MMLIRADDVRDPQIALELKLVGPFAGWLAISTAGNRTLCLEFARHGWAV